MKEGTISSSVISQLCHLFVPVYKHRSGIALLTKVQHVCMFRMLVFLIHYRPYNWHTVSSGKLVFYVIVFHSINWQYKVCLHVGPTTHGSHHNTAHVFLFILISAFLTFDISVKAQGGELWSMCKVPWPVCLSRAEVIWLSTTLSGYVSPTFSCSV